MKMGNIASPWRYDAGACYAFQSASLRPAAILRYAGYVAAFRNMGQHPCSRFGNMLG